MSATSRRSIGRVLERRPGRGRPARQAAATLLLALVVLALRAAAVVAFFSDDTGTQAARAAAATLPTPADVTAVPLGSSAIRIGWSAPPTVPNGTTYLVERVNPDAAVDTVCNAAPASGFCDAAVAPGTVADFRVTAALQAWRSPSIEVSATTPVPVLAITIPATPAIKPAGTAVPIASLTATVNGVADPTYHGTRTLTWSGLDPAPDGAAPTPPASTFTFANGVATGGLGSFRPVRAGAVTLTATEPATGAQGSVTLTVGDAGVSGLRFTTQPGDGVAGTPLSAQPVVAIVDPFGNLVTGAGSSDTIRVTLEAAGGAATFSTGSSFAQVAAVGGIATFNGLRIDNATVGPHGLLASNRTRAMEPSLYPSTAFNVSPGPAAMLRFTSVPSTVTAGAPFSATVRLTDLFNNPLSSGPGSADTYRLVAGTPFGGTPQPTATAINGVATFTNLTLTAAGSWSLSAFSLETPSLVPLPSPITVNADVPAALQFLNLSANGPMSTTASIGSLTVQLRDRFGNLARATTGGVTVNLAASPAGTDIFGRTAGATTAVTTVQIGAFGSATSFYFGSSGLTATTVKTLTASATGLTPATVPVTVFVPDGLRVTAGAGSVAGVTGDADCSVIAVTSSCTLRLSRSGDVKLDLTLVRSGNIATPYSASTSTTVLRDGVALTPAIPAGGSAYTGIPVPSATVPVTTVLTVGPYTVTVTVVPPGA